MAKPEPGAEARNPPAAGRGVGRPRVAMALALILATQTGVCSVRVAEATRNRRLTCQRNLKELGTLLTRRRQGGQDLTHGLRGTPILLWFRCVGNDVKKGQEAIFFCAYDEEMTPPTSPQRQAEYDEVDLTDQAGAARFCSHLVRDFERFPLAEPVQGLEILAVCPHHEDGVVALFDDGSARFLDREQLGVDDEEPTVVGPESSHPDLRKILGSHSQPPPSFAREVERNRKLMAWGTVVGVALLVLLWVCGRRRSLRRHSAQ